jgi:hypothetical protein
VYVEYQRYILFDAPPDEKMLPEPTHAMSHVDMYGIQVLFFE